MSLTLSACSARSDARRTSVAGSFFNWPTSSAGGLRDLQTARGFGERDFHRRIDFTSGAASSSRFTAARAARAVPALLAFAEVIAVDAIQRRRRAHTPSTETASTRRRAGAAGVGRKRRDTLRRLVAADAQVRADRPAQQRLALEPRLLQDGGQRRQRRLDSAVVVDGTAPRRRRCARPDRQEPRDAGRDACGAER